MTYRDLMKMRWEDRHFIAETGMLPPDDRDKRQAVLEHTVVRGEALRKLGQSGYTDEEITRLNEIAYTNFGSSYRMGQGFDVSGLDYSGSDWYRKTGGIFGYNLEYASDRKKYAEGELPYMLEKSYDTSDPEDAARLAQRLPSKKYLLQMAGLAQTLESIYNGTAKKWDFESDYPYDLSQAEDRQRKSLGMLSMAAEKAYGYTQADAVRKSLGINPEDLDAVYAVGPAQLRGLRAQGYQPLIEGTASASGSETVFDRYLRYYNGETGAADLLGGHAQAGELSQAQGVARATAPWKGDSAQRPAQTGIDQSDAAMQGQGDLAAQGAQQPQASEAPAERQAAGGLWQRMREGVRSIARKSGDQNEASSGPSAQPAQMQRLTKAMEQKFESEAARGGGSGAARLRAAADVLLDLRLSEAATDAGMQAFTKATGYDPEDAALQDAYRQAALERGDQMVRVALQSISDKTDAVAAQLLGIESAGLREQAAKDAEYAALSAGLRARFALRTGDVQRILQQQGYASAQKSAVQILAREAMQSVDYADIVRQAVQAAGRAKADASGAAARDAGDRAGASGSSGAEETGEAGGQGAALGEAGYAAAAEALQRAGVRGELVQDNLIRRALPGIEMPLQRAMQAFYAWQNRSYDRAGAGREQRPQALAHPFDGQDEAQLRELERLYKGSDAYARSALEQAQDALEQGMGARLGVLCRPPLLAQAAGGDRAAQNILDQGLRAACEAVYTTFSQDALYLDAEKKQLAHQAQTGMQAALAMMQEDAQATASAFLQNRSTGARSDAQATVHTLLQRTLECCGQRMQQSDGLRSLYERMQSATPQALRAPQSSEDAAREMVGFSLYLLGGVAPAVAAAMDEREGMQPDSLLRIVGRGGVRQSPSAEQVQAMVLSGALAAADLDPGISLAGRQAADLLQAYRAQQPVEAQQVQSAKTLLRDLSVETFALQAAGVQDLSRAQGREAFRAALQNLAQAGRADIALEAQGQLQDLSQDYDQARAQAGSLLQRMQNQPEPGLALAYNAVVQQQAAIYARIKPLQERLDAQENRAYMQRRAQVFGEQA